MQSQRANLILSRKDLFFILSELEIAAAGDLDPRTIARDLIEHIEALAGWSRNVTDDE